MNVDREQQREILQALFEVYPWTTDEVSRRIHEMIRTDKSRAVGNLLYLQMHGLITECVEVISIRYGKGNVDEVSIPFHKYHGCPRLTEKGIDFLLGDDGLSAILNTRTIRIDERSIRLVAQALIESSSAAPAEKESALEGLKKIPGAVLQKWLTELGEKSMPSHEAVMELIRTLVN